MTRIVQNEKCVECGGDTFIQKETRKTGVVLRGGKAHFKEQFPVPKFVAYICQKCGCQMPAETVETFKPMSLFPETSAN